jgi:hypothetical protein
VHCCELNELKAGSAALNAKPMFRFLAQRTVRAAGI